MVVGVWALSSETRVLTRLCHLLAGGLAADTEPPKYSISLLRYEWKDSNIKRDHDCKEFCIVLGT